MVLQFGSIRVRLQNQHKSEGSLESWRSGASLVLRVDHDAIMEQRRQLGVIVLAVAAEVEPAESQGATSHVQLAMLD